MSRQSSYASSSRGTRDPSTSQAGPGDAVVAPSSAPGDLPTSSTSEGASIKTIFLIRHGESEENVEMASLFSAGNALKKLRPPKGADLKRASSFLGGAVAGKTDAPLSEFGKRQAGEMGRVLAESGFLERHGIRMVAHSPLQRARETCRSMLGCAAAAAVDTSASCCAVGEDTDAAHPGVAQSEPMPAVHHVAEVLELECLRESTPYEQVLKLNWKVRGRIREFQRWISSRKEDKIAVVGHSQFFMAMLNLPKFRNCDVWRFDFSSATQSEGEEGGDQRWSGATLLHRYEGEK